MFKKVFEYAGPHKKDLYIATFIVLLSVLMGVLPFVLAYQVISPLVMGNAVDTKYVCIRVIGVLICLILQAILYGWGLDVSHKAAYSTLLRLRTSLQKRFEAVPLGFIQDKGTGTIKKLFVDDVDSLEVLLAHSLPEGIANLMIPIAIYVAMFFIDWKLALLSLASIPISFAAMMIMYSVGMKKMGPYYMAGQKMNNTIIEYINGMEVVKVFNKDAESYERFRKDMAICYDFDKTLSPDDMQTFTLIPSFGIDKDKFWAETDAFARENSMESNLSWMFMLVRYSRFLGKSLKREYFRAIGAQVELYRGVTDWFTRTTAYAAQRGIELEHYIISSGLKEIIEGSAIAKNFKRIYASSYLYTTDGVAEWPAQAINYTNKTQFIFRIAKGFLEEYDERVNDSMPEENLRIPYENIVYIGDSATDIPCMRLVKSKGGYSVGVYDPEKNNRAKVYKLYNDDRLNFYAPADYTERSNLYRYMQQIIDEVAAREQIKSEREILRQPAEAYKMRSMLEKLETGYTEKLTPQEITELQKLEAMIKSRTPGEID